MEDSGSQIPAFGGKNNGGGEGCPYLLSGTRNAREVAPEEKVLTIKGGFYGIIPRGINHRVSVGKLYVGERVTFSDAFCMKMSGEQKGSTYDYDLWIPRCYKILSDSRDERTERWTFNSEIFLLL